MISNDISPGEYAQAMTEEIESLVVKCSRKIEDEDNKISGVVINNWKWYTMQYFKFSPNAFFYESQFYQNLSEHLKIKVI